MDRKFVRGVIKAQLVSALRMDGAGVRDDEPFADYGVDSIIGVNLVRTINEALGVELETTSLFEYSTLERLTEHVLATWGHGAIEGAWSRAAAGAPDEAPREREFGRSQRFAAASDVRPGHGRAGRTSPIAIIGMSGRFARSETLEEFWSHVRAGADLVTEVSRWSAAECAMSPVRPYCTRGSFIDSIADFDPEFFRISAREALYMDPQQRLFLEESWKALEDAGHAGAGVQERKCGVYVGCGSAHYDDLFVEEPPAHAFWGNSESVIPARIAYHLNLHGPAIAVNTACSSSLVTIHLACQGLWSGETEMALAGGVFLQATPNFYQVANRAAMLSPEGRCFSFDSRANGFVPGEGVGAVVLRRLEDALRDGDHVHGVIVGSGMNQDGSTNGLVAPSARAQEQLQRGVYERFHIDPQTIQMVEAHGTGTLLGDAIEFNAITSAFRGYTERSQFCALGSIKTNIGHAATAAGIAGVLKILLALKNREIPPTLNFAAANPAIDFASSPFYLNAQLKEWPATDSQPRRAAISSFGFSGTNAHLVIEEAPTVHGTDVSRPGFIVALSARTVEQLKRQAENLRAFLTRRPGIPLNDVSYTLFTGRAHLSHRLSCIVSSQEELLDALASWPDSGAAHVRYSEVHGTVHERSSLRRLGDYCIRRCSLEDRSTDGAADAAAEYRESLATIADLYGQGYSLNFAALFPAGSRRLPLPTHPFAGERYWVAVPPPTSSDAVHAPVHPLLHRITSVLGQQSYLSEFTGRESFLPEAPSAGDTGKIFPMLLWLEMARAALTHAAGPAPEGGVALILGRTTWGPPLRVTRGATVGIAVFVEGDEDLGFEIFSGTTPAERIHCQGLASFRQAPTPLPVDIGELLATLPRDLPDPQYPQLATVHRDEHQVVAALETLASDRTSQEFWLHPDTLRGLLQACTRLLREGGSVADGGASPIALGHMRILALTRQPMTVWVRRVGDAEGAGGTCLDADVLDGDGAVCVELRGLCFEAAWSAPQSVGADFEDIEAFLKRLVALELDIPVNQVATDQSFFDMGVTSLGVTRLVQGVNAHLQANLSPSLLFDHRDIDGLCDHLRRNHPGKLAGTAGPAAEGEETTGQPGAETVEKILWRDDEDAGTYEKITF